MRRFNLINFSCLSIVAMAAIFLGTNLIFVRPATAGQLEDGVAAYEKRDFYAAEPLLRPLAEQGNATAERTLGIMYDNGFAVPRDASKATVWFGKAADQGDAEAEYRLGEIYIQGVEGVPRDHDRGYQLMTNAADQGNADSMYQLGEYYRVGMFGFSKDQSQAIVWQKRAADHGSSSAASRLGIAYEFGQGVPQDTEQANFWYKKASDEVHKKAEQGNVAAELNLGLSYEMGGQGYVRNLKTALYWYQKAIQQDGPSKLMAEAGITRVNQNIAIEHEK